MNLHNKHQRCNYKKDGFSAFWIAHRACKYVFDDIDGLVPAPKPISYVWPAMRHYFNVTDRKEILPHFYKDFDKSIFAMFAKEIVTGCEKKDPLCLYIISENGRYLAKHVIALSRKAHNVSRLFWFANSYKNLKNLKNFEKHPV